MYKIILLCASIFLLSPSKDLFSKDITSPFISKTDILKKNYNNLITIDELDKYEKSLNITQKLFANIKYTNPLILEIIKYQKLLTHKKSSPSNPLVFKKLLLNTQIQLKNHFNKFQKKTKFGINSIKFSKETIIISKKILVKGKKDLNLKEFNILTLFILNNILLNYSEKIIPDLERNNTFNAGIMDNLQYIKFVYLFIYNNHPNIKGTNSFSKILLMSKTLNMLGMLTFKINEINTAIDNFKAALFLLFQNKRTKKSTKLIAEIYNNIHNSYATIGTISNAKLFKDKYNYIVKKFKINTKNFTNINYITTKAPNNDKDIIYRKNILKSQIAKVANIIKLDKVTTRSYMYSIKVQDIVDLGSFKIKIHTCILPAPNSNFKKNNMLALVSVWDNENKEKISPKSLIYKGWLNSFNKSLDSFSHYRFDLELRNCK